MICVQTYLFVTDNSGALYAQCIKILGNVGHFAHLGDKVVVSIKRAKPTKKIKEHEVRIGIVVRSKRITIRRTGMCISFFTNAIVLVDARTNPVGTRIFGTVAQELRQRKQMKLLIIAQSVL